MLFEIMKMKKMENIANKFIVNNFAKLSDYVKEIRVVNKPNYITVVEKDEKIYYDPIIITGAYKRENDLKLRIGKVNTVVININTIYYAAKEMGMKPEDLLVILLKNLISDLEYGYFPDLRYPTKKYQSIRYERMKINV